MGGGRSDTFQAGVHGRLTQGPFYAATALAYSMFDVTTNRTGAAAGVGVQTGAFTANMLSNRVELGYDVPLGGGLKLTPYAANEFQSLTLPSFAETGATGSVLSLNYLGQTVNSDRTELGAWADYSVGALKIFARAAWAHDFNDGWTSNVVFQALPGNAYTVYSAKASPDSAISTIGAQYNLGGGWSVGVKLDGQFSSAGSNFSANGVIRKTW
jgi:uncharacterized protein with beta-barrel porin domain